MWLPVWVHGLSLGMGSRHQWLGESIAYEEGDVIMP